MPLFNRRERRFLEAVSNVAFGNPFLPELADNEHAALGTDYAPEPPFWSIEVSDPGRRRANAWKIAERLKALLDGSRLRAASNADESELRLYEDAALYALYHEFYDRLDALASATQSGAPGAPFYREFLESWNRLLRHEGRPLPSGHQPAHTFACFFQIARAFQNIFASIIGASAPAGRLRAAVWQSIFTHDMRRYRRTFYARMGDFVTLVTGPSGSGKELVARAIALSRYLPFDERTCTFAESGPALFQPIHIAALPGTLVESELFGHRKGAFTGAVDDRRGWLDTCPALGAVFLDELGELTPEIQVKLLRVIETRMFTAVGDTAPRRFKGKLIAATNRDLATHIAAGRFREDLYYRMCSDLITTPSLRDQIADNPGVLKDLVAYMARRNAGPEADALAAEAFEWIERNLGIAYEWPGNYRELEQCVRNLMIRSEYRPAHAARSEDTAHMLAPALEGRITAAELLRRYCTFLYSQNRSYEATARRTGLDRRTVKAYLIPELLRRP